MPVDARAISIKIVEVLDILLIGKSTKASILPTKFSELACEWMNEHSASSINPTEHAMIADTRTISSISTYSSFYGFKFNMTRVFFSGQQRFFFSRTSNLEKKRLEHPILSEKRLEHQIMCEKRI